MYALAPMPPPGCMQIRHVSNASVPAEAPGAAGDDNGGATGIVHGSKTIVEVIRAARRLTGKPAQASDEQLAAWLVRQEVATEADFLGLTDEAMVSVAQAPGASLVLVDALRRIRRDAVDATGPQRARLSSEPAAEAAGAGPARYVEVAVQGHVATLTLCNDAKRNALSTEACHAIQGGLEESCHAGVRVIILRAKPGSKVFCAGHDVRDFLRTDGSAAKTGSGSFLDPLASNDPFVKLLEKIRELPVPVIGCVEGSVWGGATDLCACCDVLIGTPDVTFAITPAKLGLPYHASGMAHFSGVLPVHVIKWMFMSGSVLSADEALRHGFLNEVVPPEQLTERAEMMASIIASRAPLVVGFMKRTVNQLCSAPALSAALFEDLHEMRETAFRSEDMQEGVRAFFERREPMFQGR